MNQTNIKRMTTSAVMLALATVLALVCALIPFLHLPFGGGFTIASMLPIVVISYMYGLRWGFFTSGVFALIQIMISLFQGSSSTVMLLFTPADEGFMGYGAAIAILIIDYLLAYGILGIGGIFRKRVKNQTAALVLGVVVALSLRYLCHIVSGFIFYGSWAEWFFTQENFYAFGSWVVDRVDGLGLSLLYSVFYNGLYMIPEIIVTALCAVPVSRIRYVTIQN